MPRKALNARDKKENEEIIDTKAIEEKLTKNLEKKISELTSNISSKIDEQIEFKIDKFMKEEEKKYKRKNRFKIFRLNFIILLLLLIVLYFAYCLYDVDYFHIRTFKEPTSDQIFKEPSDSTNTNDDRDNEEKFDKELAITTYKYLFERLLIDDQSIEELFQNEYTLNNIPNDLKLKLAYKNLNENLIKKDGEIISFTKEDLNRSLTNILGTAALKDESFTYNNTRFMFYNDIYIGERKEDTKVNFTYQITDIALTKDQIDFKVLINESTDDQEEQNTYIKTLYNVSFKQKENNYSFIKIQKIPE